MTNVECRKEGGFGFRASSFFRHSSFRHSSFELDSGRVRVYWRWCLMLFGWLALGGLAGCGAIQLNSLGGPRLEHEMVAGAPTRNSLRVSQFVFYSDFD